MDIAKRIGQVGFRKWYERQLIDSHLALTTCFLCAIVVAAGLEAVQLSRPDWGTAGLLGLVFAATGLGWYSWRRYITVLRRAEIYGSRSTCPSCAAYARFEVIAAGQVTLGPYLDPQATPLPYPWLRVRCRKCGTVWRMPE